MAGIGHNSGISLDAVVEENLRRGLYLVQRDVLIAATRDPRLGHRHRVVLCEIIERMNSETGLAYPGRKLLAEDSSRWLVSRERDTYSESGIAKTISELINFGYLVSERRSPPGSRRAIAHYTIAKPSIEELQEQITIAIQQIRRKDGSRRPQIQGQLDLSLPPESDTRRRNVTPSGNDTPQARNDMPQRGNVTWKADVTPVAGADVTTGPEANVTPGTATGTSIGTSLGTSSLSPPTPSQREPARASEQRHNHIDLGHGVSFDGETIKHACFAIHVPSIEYRVMGVAVSKERVLATAKASALQWAVEIENGKSPSHVVPQYIPGAIASTLIREARYAEAHSASIERRRSAQSSDHRGRVRFSSNGGNHGRR
jgi:hypothetical protein